MWLPPNFTRYTTDGIALPDDWDRTLAIRWVLDPEHPEHCEACLAYAGEYLTRGKMSVALGGSEPGYFPHCVKRGGYTSKFDMLESCGEECRCWLEVNVEGEWNRLKPL
jgi:hypothetical protein